MKTCYRLFNYFKGSPHSKDTVFIVPIINGELDCEKCKKCLTMPFTVARLLLGHDKLRQLLWVKNKPCVHFN